jgi:hypothetical protein
VTWKQRWRGACPCGPADGVTTDSTGEGHRLLSSWSTRSKTCSSGSPCTTLEKMRSRRLTFAFFSLLAHGLHCTAPDVQIRICLFVLVEESSPLSCCAWGMTGVLPLSPGKHATMACVPEKVVYVWSSF